MPRLKTLNKNEVTEAVQEIFWESAKLNCKRFGRES